MGPPIMHTKQVPMPVCRYEVFLYFKYLNKFIFRFLLGVHKALLSFLQQLDKWLKNFRKKILKKSFFVRFIINGHVNRVKKTNFV